MRLTTFLGCAVLCAAVAGGCESSSSSSRPTADGQALAKLASARTNFVRVQYWLQYAEGEEPKAPGWVERCPNCGAYHVNRANDALSDERPIEIAGVILTPTRIVLQDPQVHARFVNRISVVHDGKQYPAKVSAYALDHSAVMLELESPLPGAQTLAFEAKPEGPYSAMTCRQLDAQWTATSAPWSPKLQLADSGKSFVEMPSPALIVDRAGRGVALAMEERMPADGWQGSPGTWKWIPAAEMDAKLQKTRDRVEQAIVRVTLSFRSPPAGDVYGMGRRDSGSGETEMNVPAILYSGRRLLVLADVTPTRTARLEQIRVHLPGGAQQAKFAGSLADYSALVAELEQDAPGSLQLSDRKLQDLQHEVLLAAELHINGESRRCWYSHLRIGALEPGWHEQVRPENSGDEQTFAFDGDGRLVLLPISMRKAVRPDWDRGDRAAIVSAGELAPILADTAKHCDVSNIPLSEQEENRLGWLGVELQELTEELAKENGVADQFDHSSRGGLVSYVYPDSPAAKAGVQAGHVLMRLRLPNKAEPVAINGGGYGGMGDMAFPWDRLDEVPAEYMDRIPQPWPSAASPLNRTLTDIGIGKQVIAEFYVAGKPMEKTFVIEVSPTHFDAAAKIKSDPYGMTVRDLSYEVRRFYQRPEGEPGVIVSKIQPGSRAAIAGLRPFEIITHVNEQPIMDVKQFEGAISGQKELKLSVKRMARGRIVKLTLPEKQETTAFGE